MSRVARLVTAICLLLAVPARAQVEGVFTIPEFKFEQGGDMQAMKVGYVTWGKLNDRKDNAILLLPATNAPKGWPAYHIGQGKTFDPDKYFIIGVDPVGSGTSSQPKDGLGLKFPAYTIRDMVRAEYALLTKQFGLSSLVAVGGASMGSFQSLEWGINYPGFAKSMVLWVPAARSERHFQIIVDAMEAVITLDPAYKDGNYITQPVDGLRRSGLVYFPWLYGDDYVSSLTDTPGYDKAKWSFGDGFAKNWDANALMLRYNASAAHDVSKPFGGDMQKALSRIQVPILAIPSSSDRLITPGLTQELVSNLAHVTVRTLPTIRGHLGYLQPAGTPEYAFLNENTTAFLKEVDGR